MASAVKCDKCGKVAETNGLVRWLHLERTGIDVTGYGDDPGPWDFCSWLCVAEYAVKRGTSVTLHGPSTAELAGRMATELYDALKKVL